MYEQPSILILPTISVILMIRPLLDGRERPELRPLGLLAPVPLPKVLLILGKAALEPHLHMRQRGRRDSKVGNIFKRNHLVARPQTRCIFQNTKCGP